MPFPLDRDREGQCMSFKNGQFRRGDFLLGLKTMIIPLKTAAFKAVKTVGSGERRTKEVCDSVNMVVC